MFDIGSVIGPIFVTCSLGVLSFFLLLWYSLNKLEYWKKRNVPFAKSYPFVGSVLPIFFRPIHDIENERYKEMGPIYGHFEGNKPALSVADPDLMRLILIKDFQYFSIRRSIETGNKIFDSLLPHLEGEDWKRIRTIVTPTFTTGKIKRMLNVLKECTKSVVQNFKNESANGPVEAKRIYGAFTLDVIANTAFSTKLDSHNDPENKFVKYAKNAFTFTFNWRAVLFFTSPWAVKLLKVVPISKEPLVFFRELTLQIIEERKRTGQTRNDFLQLLMDTAKEDLDDRKTTDTDEKDDEDLACNYSQEGMNDQIFKTVTKKNLSMDELTAQCVIFFLAGYDTTASSLSFITYNLALYPDVQQKAYEEVVNTLKETNGKLIYEAIQNMKYIDNVISESLRLFPPVVRTDRTSEADYKLGETGITIEKGTIISIPIYSIHRDSKFYSNPETFDPDRFTFKERSKRDPCTFLPFGIGPRHCVGMRFALMEIKVCLVYVLAHFKINRCPQTKVPLEFTTGGFLQTAEIMIEMENRKDCIIEN